MTDHPMEQDWKVELRNEICGTDESKVLPSEVDTYERVLEIVEPRISAAEARGREEILNEDTIDKIECLIGYVEAAGNRKYPYGSNELLKVSEEAKGWLEEIKKLLSPSQGSSNGRGV